MANKCSHCGSLEHTVENCPHKRGLFFGESSCRHCGSSNHPSDQCPHERGFFFSETECRHCGSKEHASKACPHKRGLFFSESSCRYCGSSDHASDKCPHERSLLFSETQCRHCGSKNHSSNSCPHNKNTGIGFLGWLIGVVIVIMAVVWLAVYIVLPVTLLNSALAFTILAAVKKRSRRLWATFSLLGAAYMFADIWNGWFSHIFVTNVVKNHSWISGFLFINSAAVGLSACFLVIPLWESAKNMNTTQSLKKAAALSGIISLVLIATLTMPVVYLYKYLPERKTATAEISTAHQFQNSPASFPSTGSSDSARLANSTPKPEQPVQHVFPGKYPQASERLLSMEEIINLDKRELKIMRNEIFARHGYRFRDQSLRDYFEKQVWYRDISDDVSKDLTAIEVQNISLLKKLE